MVRGTRQTVTISSEPSGANVTVDGNDAGTTPTSIKLARHEAHAISIKKGWLPALPDEDNDYIIQRGLDFRGTCTDGDFPAVDFLCIFRSRV